MATGGKYDAPYRSGVGPTIDGSMSVGEWDDAVKYSLTFEFNDTQNPVIEVELYLLHNGSAIFIGINITTADNQSDIADRFSIYFDEDNNGLLSGNITHPKEEGLELTRDGNFTDLSFNGIEWIFDESIVNLTKGPSNGATNGVNQWEFIVVSTYDPEDRFMQQDSSDFDVDLPSVVIENAVEVGFDIEYYDADLNQTDSFCTTGNCSVSTMPALWDDLVCGKVPNSPPNMGAIWGYIIIGMIVPGVLILYMILWITKKKVD